MHARTRSSDGSAVAERATSTSPASAIPYAKAFIRSPNATAWPRTRNGYHMRVSRAKLLTLSALLVGLGETAAADPGVADQTLAPDTGFGGGRQWKLTLGDYQYSGYSGQDLNLTLAAQRHARVARCVRPLVRDSGARGCRQLRRPRRLRRAPTIAAGGHTGIPGRQSECTGGRQLVCACWYRPHPPQALFQSEFRPQ